MTPRSLLTGWFFFFFMSAVCGCKAPLNYDKPTTLEPGAETLLTIDGPASDQKVKIDISCPDPIEVKVYLESDKSKTLVNKKDVKNESFEVTIPAKQNFVIYLMSLKKTIVSVKARSL